MMTAIETPANWRELQPNQWCEKIAPAILEHREKVKQSIQTEGFRTDDCYRIVLYQEADGSYSILDGRTRKEVCAELDTEGVLKNAPLFAVWSPDDETDSPWLFALRSNADRRHLNKSQLGALALDDPRKELLKAEARQAQAEAGVHGVKGGRGNKTLDVSDTPRVSSPASSKRTSAKLAKNAGTNEAAVQQCQRLEKQAPDLLQKVRDGEIGSAAAIKILALRKCAPDLAKKVEGGKMSISAAERKAVEMGLKPAPKPRAPKVPAQLKESSSTGGQDSEQSGGASCTGSPNGVPPDTTNSETKETLTEQLQRRKSEARAAAKKTNESLDKALREFREGTESIPSECPYEMALRAQGKTLLETYDLKSRIVIMCAAFASQELPAVIAALLEKPEEKV